MTLRPNWRADAAMLADVPPEAEIGLHLVLTEEDSLVTGAALPRLHALHRQARRSQLDHHAIADEVDAQFARFADVLGRPPAFVDGHQHAHALPVIRDIVLEATRRHAPAAWVRTCEERPEAIARRPFAGKAIGSAFHARGLRGLARRHALVCNRGFAGHYDFKGDWRTLFPRFLGAPGLRHLVMCHPGADDRAGDVIAAARVREAAALAALPVAAMAAAHGLAFA